jgi:hypothetical protein
MMRPLGAIAGAVLVCFLVVIGFFWVKDGSLEKAGAAVDHGIAQVDKSTKPLQHEMKNVGEATKESVKRATDGDNHT